MKGSLEKLAAISGLLLLLFLERTVAHGAPFSLAALGDSVSDTYFLKVSLFDRSWTDLLRSLRSGPIRLYNKAVAGSTSTTMLLQQQPEAVADLVRQGKVQNVCLIVGGNDLGYQLLMPQGQGRTGLDRTAAQLVANIAWAIDRVRSAGLVAAVVGNLPDLGDTPAFRSWSRAHPDQAVHLARLTEEVNRHLEALARARRIPIVDVYRLTRRSRQPLYMGGVDVSASLFTSDGIHPSTIGSGLLGNVILEAFRIGYGRDTGPLLLTDHEIVAKEASVATGARSFDAAQFVLFPKAESPAATSDSPGHKSWRTWSRIVWKLIVPSLPVLGLLVCWFWYRWRRSRSRLQRG